MLAKYNTLTAKNYFKLILKDNYRKVLGMQLKINT